MKYAFSALALTGILAASVLPAAAGGDLVASPAAVVRSDNNCEGGKFSGPYIGANAGWVSGDSDQTSLNNGAKLSSDDDAIAAGVLVGYNRQCGSRVYGLESDLSWTNYEATGVLAGQSLTTSYDYFGTLRGRIGFVHDENVLFYLTGGLAYANVDHQLLAPGFGINQSDSDLKFGYTIGGGIELSRGRWTMRAEALYVDLGDTKIDYTGAAICGGVCRANIEWDDDFVVARVGLTLRLDREEPKYEPLK